MAIPALIIALSLLLAHSLGFRNITVNPFSTIHMQTAETLRFPLDSYFVGQKLLFSSTNANLTINSAWERDVTCSKITKRLKAGENITQIVPYEDTQQPFRERVLYFATTAGRVFRTTLQCKHPDVCNVIECNYDPAARYFAWGQAGERFIHIFRYNNRLSVHVQDPTEFACQRDNSYPISSTPDTVVPLDTTKLVVVRNRQLALVEFAPSERVLYVNLPTFANRIQQAVVIYPLIITLETVSNEVQILQYDPEYEDLFAISRFTIPEAGPIHQLFFTQHEPHILLAVAEYSDKVFLYDISSSHAPRLLRIYFDPDFDIHTTLADRVSRLAMTCNYIAVLAGDIKALTLRLIRKGRDLRNYIVDDIPLGSGHTSPSLITLNYYANRFMVSLEDETRVFALNDSMLTLSGERLSNSDTLVTHITSQITAQRSQETHEQSTVDIFVYPAHRQFSTVLRERAGEISWVGYEGQKLTVDLTRYYMGSAITLKRIQANENTIIEKQDKILFVNRVALSWNDNCYAAVLNSNGDVTLVQVTKQAKRIVVKYSNMTLSGEVATSRTVASIDYARNFRVLTQTFSDDLQQVFIHVKFNLTDGDAYLLYYTGYDAKTVHFVTELDLGTGSECDPVVLRYQESVNYVFSAMACKMLGGIYGSVARFRLSPSSPTTVVATSQFRIVGRYLLDVYVGSDIYSAYITSGAADNQTDVRVTFTEPYFQNEHSVVEYEFAGWDFVGAQYCPRRLILFLTNRTANSDTMKEFSVLTATDPTFKRNLNLPPGHRFVKDGNDTVISDIEGDYMGVMTTAGENYCFVIYCLAQIGISSLYAFNCSFNLTKADSPPVFMDVLKVNEAMMYVLVYTQHAIYRMKMSTTYDANVQVKLVKGSGVVYPNRFNVTVQSRIDSDPLTFEVTTQQITSPPVLNISKSEIKVHETVTDLSKLITGYDLYVSQTERIPGVTVASREIVVDSVGVHQDSIVLAGDVEAVLPLAAGEMICTKTRNSINVLEVNRGETQLQVVPDIIDVRVAYLRTEGPCDRFAIYNSAPPEMRPGSRANMEDFRFDTKQIPQVKLASRCQKKNFVYEKRTAQFNMVKAHFASIQQVLFDDERGLLYVVLNPRLTYHYVAVSHYIAVLKYNETGFSEPEYIMTERDFVEVTGHLRISAAALVNSDLYLALEGYGLARVRYDTHGERKVWVYGFPLQGEDARFRADKGVTRLFYNRKQLILYALYSMAGLIYIKFPSPGGELNFSTVPLFEPRAHFTDLYADENVLLIAGNTMECDFIHVLTWKEEKLVPRWKMMLCGVCKRFDSAWLDGISKQEFEAARSFRVYFLCDGFIRVLTVRKSTELFVNYDALPAGETIIHLLATSSATWDLVTLQVNIVNDSGETYYVVMWCIVGGIILLLAAGIAAVCWYKRRNGAGRGELETGFLFDDTNIERARARHASKSVNVKWHGTVLE